VTTSGPYRATVDPALAYRAHLAALAESLFAASPGYRRADARLRAGRRPGRSVGTDPRVAAEAPVGLAELLDPEGAGRPAPAEAGSGAASGAPGERGEGPPSADAAWFEARWSGWDAEACRAEAGRLAAEASRVATHHLLSGCEVEVIVATGLRRGAWAALVSEGRLRLAAGPQTPGIAAALAAVAARLPLGATLGGLSEEHAWLTRLHVAGSALVALPRASEDLDALLEAAAAELLPPQHQSERLGQLVTALREGDLLDQPPGEIERLTRGMQRRRVDRLHRAWQRGFFVPRGFDLEAWLERGCAG